MKKRINLMILLVISFVILANNVSAATDLTCVYKSTSNKGVKIPALKIVQNANGTKEVYTNSKESNPIVESSNWKKVSGATFNKELTSCPNYAKRDNKIVTFPNTKTSGAQIRINEEKINDRQKQNIEMQKEKEINKTKNSAKSKTTIVEEKEEIKSCEDLFDDDVRDFINKIMSWVKILVPILLIIYGVLDFSKSVFDGKEDEMKKNRDRFIKRIIAAILVFFVPMFVNLMLTLANSVWSWMSPTTCIK